MKNIISVLFIGCFFLFLGGCEDVETRKPFGENDGKVPGKVVIEYYAQIPGGVILKYIAPSDADLMYIKAKYTLDNGKQLEARASLYSDELVIEGFGNTDTKTLSISAVDRQENEGEAITYEVNPGIPPCVMAYESLQTGTAFGGMAIDADNLFQKLLYVDVLTADSTGAWQVINTEYTSSRKIKFSVRGFEALPRDFRVVVRDIYGNTSPVYETNVTPLFEEQLDLKKFRAVILPGDLKMDVYGNIEALFNGKNHWGEFNLSHSPDFNEFPVWFTFDMGVKARISRYKYWQRLDGAEWLYDHGNMKTWEVWGCVNAPDPSGSWLGWTKLMDCESIKPSGYPFGSVSEEDIEYAKKGEEYELPVDAPAVRYIRIKVLSTHADKGLLHIQQLWFWGQVVE
ncbi:MAG: hypothetical protein EZS26_002613 [Candidatus Ordinivivax streblomastigis]|uniref:DUF4959 domain-containing protein n=1 Tax=Candidatus Ordinivivax streblomastigis TaxID=2540710 RepID=A0A5M8NYB0_9BACT|nr:MAG: hypothetical protein EZS26_002613 [Candidatus Ordinivivax streblomastigis]